MALQNKQKEFILKDYFNLNPTNFMKILKKMNNTH